MAKRTFKKELRKVIYLSPKYARLFDAYGFNITGDASFKTSHVGCVIMRLFFDKMQDSARQDLLVRYNEFTAGDFKRNDDGN